MRLAELLTKTGLEASGISADPEVAGVALDSRLVRAGDIFCAAPGIALAGRAPLDGHDFIAAAIGRGASAVVGSSDLSLSVPYIRTPNPRAACALLSSEVWGRPQDKLSVIGVTGSKGKSTTVALIHHLLESAGIRAARISTLGVRFAGRDELLPGHFTTPESPQVFELLHRFVQSGCTHAVLEVSSHALELERVTGIEFDVGVWVNFYPDDHIDFHGSEAAYFAAKSKLLERSRFRILNSAEPYYAAIRGVPDEQETFGLDYGDDWSVKRLEETALGLNMDVITPLGYFTVFVPMIGAFNAMNVLAAMAAAARAGLSIPQLQAGLSSFAGVPGRMQILQHSPFRVINDFAHTGVSLTAALETLRVSTAGRLIVVVGAAGQRDPARRGGIAAAAAGGADQTVFTEEDHRTESLTAILEQMRAAYLSAGGGAAQLTIIPDRREAIFRAMRMARAGDTVLLAGKGHERTLERGDQIIAWDEEREARAAIAKLSSGSLG